MAPGGRSCRRVACTADSRFLQEVGMTRGGLVAAAVFGACLWAGPASAQPLGTFTWQLQPFCNVLTLSVVQQGPVYLLDGYDDLCGDPVRAPASGIATPSPIGKHQRRPHDRPRRRRAGSRQGRDRPARHQRQLERQRRPLRPVRVRRGNRRQRETRCDHPDRPSGSSSPASADPAHLDAARRRNARGAGSCRGWRSSSGGWTPQGSTARSTRGRESG